jgi:hypothetical protein
MSKPLIQYSHSFIDCNQYAILYELNIQKYQLLYQYTNMVKELFEKCKNLSNDINLQYSLAYMYMTEFIP